ncbi:beta-ketoacyl synthase chain length factor [Shewanella sp. MF05960]|uniref:beta-ketoacyl synthase chain length factor n=1 Tax=Shewanella sp. MF05960 TaxID=3434874 RepID=UPI003D7A7596
MHLTFKLLSWGAWSPDFQTIESWQHWQLPNTTVSANQASPALPHIPAMQRRRFSRLTKMMLSAAHDCQVAAQTRSVFSSRHGELTRTLGLLKDITQQQALSPMAFSQSVHNTASGIFGIVNHNTAASTSIAAGEQTLPQALIETYAQLAQDPTPVLMIFGDDPVPPVYSEFIHEVELPIAFGLYLALADIEAKKGVTLTLSDRPLNAQKPHNISLSELIHHIAIAKNIQGYLCHWYWSLEHHG